MREEVYWIWLQQVLGYASRSLIKVLRYFKGPKQLYDSSEKDKIASHLFNKKLMLRMKTYNIENCVKILETAEKSGQTVVPFNSGYYPQKLRRISNPPCVLYMKGNFINLDERFCVTVVGTRHATNYGMNMAFDFAYKLSKSEAIIISGGAVGIDITAHKAVLRADGVGICVLGCGIDYPYLEENKLVRQRLLKKGVLISEFPPDYKPFSRNFPIRNRMMATLCDAVLVVEAGERSGALITANLALELGKEVFAVPGNINSSYSKGTNALIRDGAKPALELDDILYDFHVENQLIEKRESLNKIDNYKTINNGTENNRLKNLSDKNKTVYNLLSEEPVNIDLLIDKSKLKVQEVLVCLTEMELLGLVKSYPGKRYGLA